VTLYVCWGLFRTFGPGHPCRNAFDALRRAGYRPEVIRSYGWGLLPDFLNRTRGRREVKRLTGNSWVPVLVTDDGAVVQGCESIIEWSEGHRL
jgi:hypothetical protein